MNNLLQRGVRQCVLVKELDMSKSALSRVRNDTDILKTLKDPNRPVNLNSKKQKNLAEFPELDEMVFKWFVSTINPKGRCKPLPLTRAVIQEHAKKFAKEMNIHNFMASDGWFSRWRHRHNIGKSVRLLGEAAEVNFEESEVVMSHFRKRLEGYEKEFIFNMDETALFYRALPNRSYICPASDSRQLGKGTKAMSAKDRLTLVLCVNAILAVARFRLC